MSGAKNSTRLIGEQFLLLPGSSDGVMRSLTVRAAPDFAFRLILPGNRTRPLVSSADLRVVSTFDGPIFTINDGRT